MHMYALNRANSLWLPTVSLSALSFSCVLLASGCGPAENILPLYLSAAAAAIAAMIWGIGLAWRDESGQNIRFKVFLYRPANAITAVRFLLTLSGIALALGGAWYGAVCLGLGFGMDFLDGAAARREMKSRPQADPVPTARVLGPWYDAESDALALFLAGWALVMVGGAPLALLAPVVARYAFGLFFSFVPGAPRFPAWYRWYSKTAAALLQVWMVAAWSARMLLPGSGFAPYINGPALSLVVLLISASFILETYFRLVYISVLFRLKEGSGLLVSFLRYYRIPLRFRRAQRLYGQFLKPGDLVFDVGAHLGGRIAVFHRLGCRLVASFPSPWGAGKDR